MKRGFLLASFVLACSGNTDTSPSGSGGVAWTTSASTGGDGAGGAGGATSTSASGGATTATGGGGGGGAGGTGSAKALVLASGGNGVLRGAYDGTSWATEESPTPASLSAPALTFAAGDGLGLVAAEAGMPNLILLFTTFGESWSDFSASGAITRAAPALEGGALAYHAPDYKHGFGLYAGGWNPIDEPIAAPGSPQSYGPTRPRLTLLGSDVVVAYAGGDGQLYLQLRSAGSWSEATAIPQAAVEEPPALVALSQGPELLAVWVNHAPNTTDHTKLFWSTRSGGTWSAASKISEQVFSSEAPELTALAGGDALLAFRGSDGMGYTLRFSGGQWGAVVPLDAAVLSPPAVARGTESVAAEIVYVTTGGVVEHRRLDGATLSAPIAVGGSGLLHATVATPP